MTQCTLSVDMDWHMLPSRLHLSFPPVKYCLFQQDSAKWHRSSAIGWGSCGSEGREGRVTDPGVQVFVHLCAKKIMCMRLVVRKRFECLNWLEKYYLRTSPFKRLHSKPACLHSTITGKKLYWVTSKKNVFYFFPLKLLRFWGFNLAMLLFLINCF